MPCVHESNADDGDEIVLMPALRFRKKDSGVVGRLIAGYGELEYLLSVCVGRSLASERNRPSSRSRVEHRSKYENMGTKMIFRVRGEKKRIDVASRLMRQSFAKAI